MPFATPDVVVVSSARRAHLISVKTPETRVSPLPTLRITGWKFDRARSAGAVACAADVVGAAVAGAGGCIRGRFVPKLLPLFHRGGAAEQIACTFLHARVRCPSDY
jgi:hypothetical protein